MLCCSMGRTFFGKEKVAYPVLSMVLIFTEEKYGTTDEEILLANAWQADLIHGSFMHTGPLRGPNILLVLNFDLDDQILLEITSTG